MYAKEMIELAKRPRIFGITINSEDRELLSSVNIEYQLQNHNKKLKKAYDFRTRRSGFCSEVSALNISITDNTGNNRLEDLKDALGRMKFINNFDYEFNKGKNEINIKHGLRSKDMAALLARNDIGFKGMDNLEKDGARVI